jgi:putative heme degradation protein
MAAFLPIMSGVSCRIRQAEGLRIDDTVFSANPLLTPAIRANVRVTGNCLQVPLLPRWSVLFRGVHTFGRVISFCGNSCGVLGSIGGYPEAWCTPCGRSASGGNLRYFFPCWHRAFVTIEEQSGAWHYSVAFLDACSDVLHTVCLTQDSDLEAFRWWVGLNHAASPGAEISSHVRAPSRVEGPSGLCEGEVVTLSKQTFSALLRRMIQEEISIQIFVGNDGLTQTAEMRPTHLREDAEWLYAADDSCGLRMRIARLTEIFLRGSSGSPDWALRAFEPEGRLVCAITPPKGSAPEDRRDALIKLEAALEENAK